MASKMTRAGLGVGRVGSSAERANQGGDPGTADAELSPMFPWQAHQQTGAFDLSHRARTKALASLGGLIGYPAQ